MAEIVKTIDSKQLRQALASMRAGGGSSIPARESRDRLTSSLDDVYRRWEGAHGTAPLDAPIHEAMRQGPEALRAACEQAHACEIEHSLTYIAGPGRQLTNRQLVRMTPLQICALLDLWREAGVLMAFGANPNLFNAEVTAIGMAAYSGSARTLCQMIAFGANATLYLLPEHAPGAPEAHGSTLLHRVAGRQIHRNHGAVSRILADCERCYPDPLPSTLNGRTPLDWAAEAQCEEARSQIAQSAAERERRALAAAAAPAPAPEKSARAPRM